MILYELRMFQIIALQHPEKENSDARINNLCAFQIRNVTATIFVKNPSKGRNGGLLCSRKGLKNDVW